jgi:hypothetical protein
MLFRNAAAKEAGRCRGFITSKPSRCDIENTLSSAKIEGLQPGVFSV